MQWISRFFGARKRREQERVRVVAAVRRQLARGRLESAWEILQGALCVDPSASPLLRLAAEVLRFDNQPETAVYFDRVADAPDAPQRLFELGSYLVSLHSPQLAVGFLQRTLEFTPFDAVARSELALAFARGGRPEQVVKTLALHPCLADDPGVLFEFAWASMLTGDLRSSRSALEELKMARGASELCKKLEHALRRSLVSSAKSPPDARDFFFLEHGSLLLDSEGDHLGRYWSLVLDEAWLTRVMANAAHVFGQLNALRRVVAIDEAHRPLADALARALGTSVVMAEGEHIPSGILALWDGMEIEQELKDIKLSPANHLLFALWTDWSRTLPRAPDVVGAFAYRVQHHRVNWNNVGHEGDISCDDLGSFLRMRRDLIRFDSARVVTAYVPDAPLPWPSVPVRLSAPPVSDTVTPIHDTP